MTSAQAKAQCRVGHSDDDAYFDTIVAAVTAFLDAPTGILRVALVEQTWQDTFTGFPATRRLPLSVEAVSAVDSVQYVAFGGTVWTTLNAANYWHYTDDLGSWVELADGASWPDVAVRPEAVRVTYKVGFGATADSVPANILHAAKLLVAHFYENREATIVADFRPTALPFAVDALLAPWKRLPV